MRNLLEIFTKFQSRASRSTASVQGRAKLYSKSFSRLQAKLGHLTGEVWNAEQTISEVESVVGGENIVVLIVVRRGLCLPSVLLSELSNVVFLNITRQRLPPPHREGGHCILHSNISSDNAIIILKS